jgi:hypothetical protein
MQNLELCLSVCLSWPFQDIFSFMDVSCNCMYPLETQLVHKLKRLPYYLTCLHLLLKVVQIDAMFFQIEILQGGRI